MRTTVLFLENAFQITFFASSPQSPENQERKSKLTEYEKEKTSKSDRKRVNEVVWLSFSLLIILLAVHYPNNSGQTMTT